MSENNDKDIFDVLTYIIQKLGAKDFNLHTYYLKPDGTLYNGWWDYYPGASIDLYFKYKPAKELIESQIPVAKEKTEDIPVYNISWFCGCGHYSCVIVNEKMISYCEGIT